jgi:hypothetical protein
MPKDSSKLSAQFEAFAEGTPNASGTVMASEAFDAAVASMCEKAGTRIDVSTIVRTEKLTGPMLRGVVVEGEVGRRKAIALVEFDAETSACLRPKANRKLSTIAVMKTHGASRTE